MLAKSTIIFAMLAILASLAVGLIFLVRDKEKSSNTVRALTIRIGLSLSLFIFLFLAFKFHWIAPHDLLQQHTA